MAKDPDFLNSLKAQGFEETQSKTKLVSVKTYLRHNWFYERLVLPVILYLRSLVGPF